MAYQPIVEPQQNRVVGFEALARFADHPLRAPNEWFAEAAEVGLGTELGLIAVEKALSGFAALDPEMFMSVNVSPNVAITDGFLEHLAPVIGSWSS